MPNKPPTRREARYLEVLEQLRRERVPALHPEIASRLGYRSVTSVWQLHDQLVAKGYLVPASEGRQLAMVSAPVPTAKALRYLKVA